MAEEKKLVFEKQYRQQIDYHRDAMEKAAMAKGLVALTCMLGKLDVAKDKFVHDHGATLASMKIRPRPPFRHDIQYGIRMADAVKWTKKYLAARKAGTAVAAPGGVGVSEDKPGSV